MQEETDPPTHVAVGRVDGKLELCVEQTFKIISQQQGRRTEVRRTDQQLEWLATTLCDEFKTTGHPAYPKVTGWLRHRTCLNKIPQDLRNEILCRYIGCILQYYLRHEKIGTNSAELYSIFASGEEELRHIMSTPVAKRGEKKKGKSWLTKIFDFGNTSGVGGCRDRSAIVFYKGLELVKKNLDMKMEKAKKECEWRARDQVYLDTVFAVVEGFGRCCTQFGQLTKAMAGVGRSLPAQQMEWFLCKGMNSVGGIANTPKCSVFDKRIQSLMNIKQKTQLHDSSPLTARGSSCSSLTSLMMTPRVRTSPMTPRVGTSFTQQKPVQPPTTSTYSACTDLKNYSETYDWTPLPPQQEELSDPGFAHVLSACGRYIEAVQPEQNTIWRTAVGPISANLILHGSLLCSVGPVVDETKKQLVEICGKVDGCLNEISHVMQTRPGDCFSRLDVKGLEERAKAAEMEGEAVVENCEKEFEKIRRGMIFGLKQVAGVFIKGQIEKAEREIEAYESVLNLLEADLVDPFDIKDIELPVVPSEAVCYTSTRTPSVTSLTSSDDEGPAPSPSPSPPHPAASLSPTFSVNRPSIVPKLNMAPSPTSSASSLSPQGVKKNRPQVQKVVINEDVKEEEEPPAPKPTTPPRKVSVADAFDDL